MLGPRGPRLPRLPVRHWVVECLYVNERWYKTVAYCLGENYARRMTNCYTCVWAATICPRNFLKYFSLLFAFTRRQMRVILQATQKLQTKFPDDPNIILGDFSSVRHMPIRNNNILVLCYGYFKGAYKSPPTPVMGTADNNCIALMPVYRTALWRGKVLT